MAAAFERGFEEGGEGVAGGFDAGEAGAEGNHVGIVVLAGKPCAEIVVDKGAAGAGDAVGGDGNADAGAADDDAEFCSARGDLFGAGAAEIGVVDAGGGVAGAEIEDIVAGSAQVFGENGLQRIARMIRCDCNLQWFSGPAEW